MEAHHIKVEKTAHYYTLGKAGPQIKKFWIVCHGYGQLASTFIESFRALEAEDTFILAPEGLSRFYWGGFVGPVVATWMTSKDRLDEIADYCNYLQGLYDHYLPQFAEDVQINLLGFSQGTATQCRWLHRLQPRFDRLLLWAGLLPDDLDFKPLSDYLNSGELHFVYGLQDQFLTEDRLKWQTDFALKNGLNFQLHSFDGKHRVQQEALLKFQ